MKKIGLVDYYLDEWHANNYPVWISEITDEYEVAYGYAEMDISPKSGETTDEWCQRMGVTKCDTIAELCEKSDYIIILAPSDPETHLRLAEAVLPYGKPTYIDKTFAPDLETAKKIFAIADTPFFSTSALRYADELETVKDAEIVTITGGGGNFPEYAIHLVEMAVILLQSPVKTARTEKVGEQRFCFLEGENGKRINLVYAPGTKYALLASGHKQINVESDFFKGLMADIIKFFDSGKVPFDSAQTLEVMRVRDMLLK